MQETQVSRPRKNGKTAQFALNIERADRIRKDPVMAMSNAARLAGYEKTNAGRPLTGKQVRRLARHDDAGLNGDARYMVKRRDRLRKPVRQSFGDRIDNVRKPTGRRGMARFGPAQSIIQAFTPVRKSEKGMDLGQNAQASVIGRLKARTAHGRRRYRGQKRG